MTMLTRLSYLSFCLALVFSPLTQEMGLAQTWSDERIERLIDELKHGRSLDQSEAAEKLLIVDPKQVSADQRKRIARAFRSMALDSSSHEQDLAIRGLVHWAGKYSIPVLEEIVDSAKLSLDESIWDALLEFDDPRCAALAASMLGNFFNHDEAVESLKQMGPIAEPALIHVAKSGNEKAALAAVEILAEVGGQESLKFLKRASKRVRGDAKVIARMAITRIESRVSGAPSESAPMDVEPDNPFAEPTETNNEFSDHPEEGDWSETLSLLPRGPGRGFLPDPSEQDSDKQLRLRAAPITSMSDGPSRAAGLLTAIEQPMLAAFLSTDPFNKRPARLERVNLKRGKATAAAPLARGTIAGALTPSGLKLAAAVEEGRHGERLRIEISDLSSQDPQLLDRWTPYSRDDKIFSTRLLWIAWVNEEEFFTLTMANDLVLWQADGAIAKWEAQVESGCRPAISPGRHQTAVSTKDGLAVLDCATGDTLAWLTEGRPSNGALAFDRSGARLACVHGPRVRIWDLTSEQLTHDFHLADLVSPGKDFVRPLSLEDDHLVVRGAMAIDVVDLRQRRILERHTHQATSGAGLGGSTLLAFYNFGRSAVIPVEAPSAKLKSPEVSDPDALLALKPGAKVSLDVRVGGGLDKEVREILTQAISDAGLVLDPNAPNRFTARLGTESEVVTYQSFHAMPWDKDATTDVNVQKKIYTITLFIEGKPAWTHRAQQGALMHLHSERNESLQQASDRQTKQSANYFRDVELPRRIVHPQHAGPLQTHEVNFRP